MGSILGGVVVRHNGKQFKTQAGSTLNPGGYTRTSKIGPDRVWGQNKVYTAPTITMVIAADEDVDVLDINAIEFATLTWEGDNGVDYMMTDASAQGPATLSDSGDINVVFEGNKVSRT